MSTTYFHLDEKNFKLSKKQIEMLDKLDDYPITYDEDCPELTDEQIEKLKRQIDDKRMSAGMPLSSIAIDDDAPELTDEQIERIRAQRLRRLNLDKKRNVSIRLSNRTIDAAKKFGKGYTNLIAEIVETTFADENLLKKYIG